MDINKLVYIMQYHAHIHTNGYATKHKIAALLIILVTLLLIYVCLHAQQCRVHLVIQYLVYVCCNAR